MVHHELIAKSATGAGSDEASYAPPTLARLDEEMPDEDELEGLTESTESMFGSHPKSARGADPLGDAQPPADPQEQPDPHPCSSTGVSQMAQNIENSLKALAKITGFVGAAIVDADSGMALGTSGGSSDFDIDVAAAANTDVVSAKLRAAEALGLEDSIDDILITLSTQYHLIRPLPKQPTIFIYVCVDRQKANLALTRIEVTKVANSVNL